MLHVRLLLDNGQAYLKILGHMQPPIQASNIKSSRLNPLRVSLSVSYRTPRFRQLYSEASILISKTNGIKIAQRTKGETQIFEMSCATKLHQHSIKMMQYSVFIETLGPRVIPTWLGVGRQLVNIQSRLMPVRTYRRAVGYYFSARCRVTIPYTVTLVTDSRFF